LAKYIPGYRVLKQDPWEVLLTALIPKGIDCRQCVSLLRETFGEPLKVVGDNVYYAFPTLSRLRNNATEKELSDCGFGRRAKLLIRLFEMLETRGDDAYLLKLRKETHATIRTELMMLPGVTLRIADIVALYALDKKASVPFDMAFYRILRKHFASVLPMEDVSVTRKDFLSRKKCDGIGDALHRALGDNCGWTYALLLVGESAEVQDSLPEKLRSEEMELVGVCELRYRQTEENARMGKSVEIVPTHIKAKKKLLDDGRLRRKPVEAMCEPVPVEDGSQSHVRTGGSCLSFALEEKSFPSLALEERSFPSFALEERSSPSLALKESSSPLVEEKSSPPIPENKSFPCSPENKTSPSLSENKIGDTSVVDDKSSPSVPGDKQNSDKSVDQSDDSSESESSSQPAVVPLRLAAREKRVFIPNIQYEQEDGFLHRKRRQKRTVKPKANPVPLSWPWNHASADQSSDVVPRRTRIPRKRTHDDSSSDDSAPLAAYFSTRKDCDWKRRIPTKSDSERLQCKKPVPPSYAEWKRASSNSGRVKRKPESVDDEASVKKLFREMDMELSPESSTIKNPFNIPEFDVRDKLDSIEKESGL